MRHDLKLFRNLTVAALFLLLGCGAPLQGKQYKGPPLQSLTGHLVVDGNAQVPSDMKAALVWFQRSGSSYTPIPQEAELQLQSSLDFTLNLYQAPPDSVLTTYPTGARVAMAWVVAYQDANGNGRVDIIPPGGRPIDHIAGGSFLYTHHEDIELVMFADRDTDAPEPFDNQTVALKKGFNVVEVRSGAAPAVVSTLTVMLQNAVSNNLDVCASDAAHPLNFSCLCDGTDKLFLRAELILHHQGSTASGSGLIEAASCNGPRSDITVTLNGKSLSYDASMSMYSLSDASLSILNIGDNDLKASLPGYPDTDLRFSAYPITITSPADNANVKAGSAVAVSWTTNGGFSSFDLSWPTGHDSTREFYGVVPQVAAGTSLVGVDADQALYTPDGSLLDLTSSAEVMLNGVP